MADSLTKAILEGRISLDDALERYRPPTMGEKVAGFGKNLYKGATDAVLQGNAGLMTLEAGALDLVGADAAAERMRSASQSMSQGAMNREFTGAFGQPAPQLENQGWLGKGLTQDLPSAIGSSAGMALVPGPKGVGRSAISVRGALVGAGQGYHEAIAAGASDGEAWASWVANAALGATEAGLPGLPKNAQSRLGEILARANKATGGELDNFLWRGVKTGFAEVTQETLQQIGQNTVARVLYDDDRAFLEGTLPAARGSALFGLIVGALAGGRAGGSTDRARPGDPGAPSTDDSVDVSGGPSRGAGAPTPGAEAPSTGPEGPSSSTDAAQTLRPRLAIDQIPPEHAEAVKQLAAGSQALGWQGTVHPVEPSEQDAPVQDFVERRGARLQLVESEDGAPLPRPAMYSPDGAIVAVDVNSPDAFSSLIDHEIGEHVLQTVSGAREEFQASIDRIAPDLRALAQAEYTADLVRQAQIQAGRDLEAEEIAQLQTQVPPDESLARIAEDFSPVVRLMRQNPEAFSKVDDVGFWRNVIRAVLDVGRSIVGKPSAQEQRLAQLYRSIARTPLSAKVEPATGIEIAKAVREFLDSALGQAQQPVGEVRVGAASTDSGPSVASLEGTEGPPSPPSEESPPSPFVDARLELPEARDDLLALANEAGWEQEGGQLIFGQEGDEKRRVVGRTKWIPRSDWWRDRPDRLNEQQVRAAVKRAVAGEKLKKAEERTVQYMLDVLEGRAMHGGGSSAFADMLIGGFDPDAPPFAVQRQRAGPSAPLGNEPGSTEELLREPQMSFLFGESDNSRTPEERARAYEEERAQARGLTAPSDDERLRRILSGVASPQRIRPGERLSTIVKGYVEDRVPGFDARGKTVLTPRDAASVFVALRSPYVERFSYLVTDDAGTVVRSGIYSIGGRTFSMVPQRTAQEIVDGLSGGLTVWISHNHPSGDSTPSTEDHRVYRRLSDDLAKRSYKMRGIITNGETFHDWDVQYDSFTPFKMNVARPYEAVPFARLPKLNEPMSVAQFVTRIQRDPGSVLAIMTDTRGGVRALVAYPAAPSPSQFSRDLDGQGATRAFFVVEQSGDQIRALRSRWGEYHGALDLFSVNDKGEIAQHSVQPQFLDEPLSVGATEVSKFGEPAEGYHGSPHDFDAFSTKKIGTGEGAQAFGYGLYFSSKKEIAESYRDKLIRNVTLPRTVLEEYFTPGRLVQGYGGTDRVIRFVGDDPNWGWSVVVQRVKPNGDPMPGERPRSHSTSPEIQEVEKALGRKLGKLYEVELVPEDDEYLDWDKPLSEQSEKVRAALTSIAPDIASAEKREAWKRNNPGQRYQPALVDALQPFEAMSTTGEAAYKLASMEAGSDKRASEILHAAGVRGIRYLDSGSRAKGEGSHNFVIFDDSDVRIRNKFAAARRPAAAPLAPQRPETGKVLGIVPKRILTREYIQDIWRPVRKLVEAAQQIGAVDDTSNVYQQEELRKGKTKDRIDRETKAHVAPLVEAIKTSGLDVDDVELYLMARHAHERNALILARTGRPDGSGMSDKTANTILAKANTSSKAKAYKDIAAKFDGLNKRTRELWVEYGLESRELVSALEGQFEKYAPLRSELDDSGQPRGVARQIRGREFKAALGRGTIAENPLIYATLDLERTIARGERNNVHKSLYELAKNVNDPNLMLVDVPPTKEALVNGVVRKVPDFQEAENEVLLKLNGELRRVRFPREYAAIPRAIKGLDIESGGILTELMGKLSRTIAGLSTRWNPFFPPVNLVRDILGAALNAQNPALLNPARLIWAAKEIATNGPWAQRFRASGAPVAFMDLSPQVIERSRQLRREIEDARTGPTARNVSRKVAAKVAEAISRLNDVAEGMTRLNAFRYAIEEQGMSEDQAASFSKNLTTNFERKGQASWINAWFAFSNAGVQSLARTGSTLKKPGARKLAAALVAGAFVLDMMNRTAGGDDEDGIPYYDKIPDYIRRTHAIVMLPGTGGDYLKIPLPFVWGWFHVLGGEMARAASSGEAGRGVGNAATALLDTVNPLGGGGTPLETITPTVLDPLVQVASGTNFAGNDIYPQQYGSKPDSELAWDDSNAVLVEIARWLNRATGGSRGKSGLIDVSPLTIEHLLRGYLGGVGGEASRIIDLGEKVASGDDTTFSDWPLWRRFAGEIGLKDQRAIYREHVQKVREAEALEKADEPYDDRLYRLRLRVRGWQDKIGDLEDEIRATSDVEEKRALRAELRETMLDAIRTVRETQQ